MLSAKPATLSRLARITDFTGVSLLLIGGGCYTRAYLGMMALRTNDGGVSSKARFAGLAEFDRLNRLSLTGVMIGAIALALLVVGAALTWWARRAARNVEPGVQPESGASGWEGDPVSGQA